MAVWSLKSFVHFAKLSPPIVIHDDGTLTGDDKRKLCGSLPRCTVIDRAEADRRMREVLKNHPECQKMRAHPGFFCALKLFDPRIYAKAEVVLLLDSDVLFFNRPTELLQCAEQGRPCFNSDYQNAYAHPLAELSLRLKIAMLPKVNAGLMVLKPAPGDFDFMEKYFRTFPDPIGFINRHEQTLNAALLSRAGAKRLGDGYQISRRRIGPRTVSHHFVADGSRSFFYTRGVRSLVERGAFAARSAASDEGE